MFPRLLRGAEGPLLGVACEPDFDLEFGFWGAGTGVGLLVSPKGLDLEFERERPFLESGGGGGAPL